ncbi:MAG TPA: hypothetical protein VGA11_04425 [Acidimicrobiia bacterium]
MGIGDGPWAMVVMAQGDTDVAVWPLYWPRAGGRPPDLSVVDAVARLQLVARRLGLDVRLCAPCPELRALLDLVGLTDAFVE